MKQKFSATVIFISFLIVIAYLAIHLMSLTTLPVFADEAIYIRWAQLIMDDASRYLFFPMNDGKTPLFIWLLVPAQYLFSDPLWAGRVVSVMIGLFQIFVMGNITQNLGGTKKSVWLSMILTTILPFWYFHHRMALIDGLLTLTLSLAVWSLIKLVQQPVVPPQNSSNKILRLIMLTGFWLGVALWSKLPALLFFFALPFYALLPANLNWSQRIKVLVRITLAALLGLFLFGLLKFTPTFGQLFSRGSDFLYPVGDVLFHGLWTTTLRNIPSYLNYFISYLSLAVILLNLYGLFSPKYQRIQWILFVSAGAIIGPITLLGRVVYPRYFLPAIIFLTVSAVLSLQEIIHRFIYHQPKLLVKLAGTIIVVTFLSQMVSTSIQFMLPALSQPDETPFVSADRTQYLEEWSSGHGITQTADLLTKLSLDHSVAVATEGYFGTLPDALLMYFHRRNVENLLIEGIGQPVTTIPDTFREKAKNYSQVLLVVNSHRLGLTLSPDTMLLEVCRPNHAPCLQVWDITDYLSADTLVSR